MGYSGYQSYKVLVDSLLKDNVFVVSQYMF